MDVRSTVAALSRWQKWALVSAIVVVLYAVFGFFVAPRIAHTQGEKALREAFGREARIGEVRINPFLLSIMVRDFELPDLDGSPFARFEELSVDFELSSIFRRAFTFAEVRIVAPFLHVKILSDGTLNAADLLAGEPDDETPASDEPEEESGPPALLIALATIERGRIVFSDYSHATPFEHEIAPLDVALRDFGTRPDDESPYSFKATTGAGEALEWEGRLSVVPLYSSGRFALTGIRPRTGWLYVQDDVYFEIVEGTVDLSGQYTLDGRAGLSARLDAGEIHVRDLAIVERETGDVALSIPELDVQGISVTHPEQSVRIAAVTSNGGRYHMVRLPDGRLRAERLVRTRSGDAAADSATATEPAPDVDDGAAKWSVVVDRVDLRGHRVEFEDRSTEPPALLAIDVDTLGLRDVTNDPTRPIQTAIGLRIGEAGRFEVEGPVQAQPPQIDLALTVEGIDLRPFEPYWAAALAIDVSSGRAGLKGRLRARGGEGDGPRVEFAGDLRIDALRTLDKQMSTDLFSWTALELAGIDLAVEPTAFRLESLTLREPAAHVVIAPDGTANLATLVVEAPGGPDATGSPEEPEERDVAAAGEPMSVTVGVVEIVGGTVVFEDRTVSPRFKTGATAIAGRIEGLTSDAEARAKVAIAGQLDGATPMRIDGVVSPLAREPYFDIRIAFENFGLTPFTPYTGRYVGKTIERGKLFVDLDYVLDGNVLVGANKVFLDQFTFGAAVDSPDATDLPVGLAVALLKDRNGEIHIDLPVRGEVDDPDFNLGGLVFGAFRNLITKVALSPFSMLGGIAGSDGDEMSAIEFVAGSASVDPAVLSKLAGLSKALAERPALSLELTGQATGEIDRPALQAAGLEADLRRVRFQELQGRWLGEKPASVDEVVMLPDERRRLIEDAFEARFGDPDGLLAVQAAIEPGRDATPPTSEALEAAREAEMARRLREVIAVDDETLRDLARRRAVAVRDELVETGGVDAARVFVLDPDVQEAPAAYVTGVAVELAAH